MAVDFTNVDKQALDLTHSIALAESDTGNGTPNYTANGDNGTSAGAYQWNNGKNTIATGTLPVNFVNAAKTAGLDPTDFSPANQDKVAYAQVKQLKDAGYGPDQIAAYWNSGLLTGWENHKGTTTIAGKAISYDTPAYVGKVKAHYQKLVGVTPSTTAPGDTNVAPVTPSATPAPAPLSSSLPVAATQVAGKAVLPLAEKIGTGLWHGLQNVAQGVSKGGASTVLGVTKLALQAGQLPEKALDQTAGRLINAATGHGFVPTTTGNADNTSLITKAQNSDALKADGAVQKVAKGAEQIGEYFVPGLDGADVVKGGSQLLEKAPVLAKVINAGSKALVRGVKGGAIVAGQTGDVKTGAEAVPTFAALDLGGQTIGAIKNAIIPDAKAAMAKFVASASTPEDVAKPLNNVIVNQFSKAFKTSTSVGAKTGAAVARKAGQMADGVRAIYENKDAFAGDLAGRLPKTAPEMLQAVQDVSGALFKKYDAIAQSAGETASFNAKPVLSKIDSFLSNEAGKTDTQLSAMRKLRTEVARHDGAAFSDVQDYLAALNKNSAGFFHTGKAPDVTQAILSVADSVRNQMYDQVERASQNPAYEGIRKQFGAVKSLEGTVAKQAGKVVPPSNYLTDLFSGSEILTGALTHNPVAVAKGIGIKAIGAALKSAKSPERAIGNMFDAVDTAYKGAAEKGIPLTQVHPPAPSAHPAMLQLPAPAEGAPNVQINQPINLPDRSQSTIDATERANPQILPPAVSLPPNAPNYLDANSTPAVLPPATPASVPAPKTAVNLPNRGFISNSASLKLGLGGAAVVGGIDALTKAQANQDLQTQAAFDAQTAGKNHDPNYDMPKNGTPASAPVTLPPQTPAAPVAAPAQGTGQTYTDPVRKVSFSDSDLSLLRNVLYAEISNRSQDKRQLEAQTIINTALNRVADNAKRGTNLSLSDVLTQKNQYQGYDPSNPQSQYAVATSGKANAEKMAAIDAVIAQLKNGTLKDNTDGIAYYHHEKDGRIVLDNKKLFSGS